jgi:anthranilate phosphoribosyltransferase
MSEVVRGALAAVVEGKTLTLDEARAAMGSVMDGEATPAQLAALLVALRMRGETVEELAGFAAAMRDRVTRVEAPEGAIDTCGTGGDGSNTFNISTAAALVVASAGIPVAKHGNRAMTSACGSADVLEALGVATDLGPEEAGAALETDGFAFLRQMIGVGAAAVAPKIAEVLRLLGAERALVVHGDGLDELPLDGRGVLYDVRPAGVTRHEVVARELGLAEAPVSALKGGTPAENAAIVASILAGAEAGPRRDVVLLNAAAAFMVSGRAEDLGHGISLAADAIDSGAAARLLERLRGAKKARDAARAATATEAAGAPA